MKEGGARKVEHMLYRPRFNAFEVFVQPIVLGEVCGVIFRDFESNQDKRNKTARLVDMMDSNGILWENMKPTEKGVFDIMVTLRGRDEWLYATNIMIISHILSDPDSKFFFTTDNNTLRNADIIDLEKDLNTNGKRRVTLKISNGF